MGTLEEVSDAVLFLCSEHAGFITGSCLRVDGGHSALGPQGKEKHSADGSPQSGRCRIPGGRHVIDKVGRGFLERQPQ